MSKDLFWRITRLCGATVIIAVTLAMLAIPAGVVMKSWSEFSEEQSASADSDLRQRLQDRLNDSGEKTVVNIPGMGRVHFPASMPLEEVRAAAQRLCDPPQTTETNPFSQESKCRETVRELNVLQQP